MLSAKSIYQNVVDKVGYWLFAIGAGAALVYLEQIENIEPAFSILAFIYWSLLIYWGTKWIIKQVRGVIGQRKEKLNYEAIHLQSQINPHFFFNTLNNLYGLMDQDPSKAKKMVLQLSEMMRYSIYEGQKEAVALAQEIAYLKQYIQLNETRYHKEIDIKFEESVEDPGQKVLPLLFITLLENAFKHGVENLPNGAFVHIKLNTTKQDLYFEVSNNFEEQDSNDHGGLGLKNLKRRLALAYPKQHEYSITKGEDVYQAWIKINLS